MIEKVIKELTIFYILFCLFCLINEEWNHFVIKKEWKFKNASLKNGFFSNHFWKQPTPFFLKKKILHIYTRNVSTLFRAFFPPFFFRRKKNWRIRVAKKRRSSKRRKKCICFADRPIKWTRAEEKKCKTPLALTFLSYKELRTGRNVFQPCSTSQAHNVFFFSCKKESQNMSKLFLNFFWRKKNAQKLIRQECGWKRRNWSVFFELKLSVHFTHFYTFFFVEKKEARTFKEKKRK